MSSAAVEVGREVEVEVRPEAAGEDRDVKTVHKFRGHTASILCCATSRDSPNAVVTASEDGTARVFDLRTKACSMTVDAMGNGPVASVAYSPVDANMLYLGAGCVVFCIDLRMGVSDKGLFRLEFNRDEINQVAVNQKSTYIAAADDSGEIKIIDVHNRKLHRTLHGAHTNICSAVQFFDQRPWEVISGGLDSKLVKWDFSKGKVLRSLDLGNSSDAAQICNPPFVHAIATSDGNGEAGRLVAVGRGDGAVEVYDANFENQRASIGKGLKNRKGKFKESADPNDYHPKGRERDGARSPGLRCHVGALQGGHSAAVSSVTIAEFGERGQFILSGGNDKFLKLWDWSTLSEESASDKHTLVLNFRHGKKVNWLSLMGGSKGHMAVADTSKILSVYQII